MSERKPKSWNLSRPLFMTLAVASMGALAIMVFLNYGQRKLATEPIIPAGATITSWYENGHRGKYVVRIADDAALPDFDRVSGTVTSDTRCEPDVLSLSHCRNDIDLDNGASITVINTHLMNQKPCLQPGQQVTITRLDGAWVVAAVGEGV